MQQEVIKYRVMMLAQLSYIYWLIHFKYGNALRNKVAREAPLSLFFLVYINLYQRFALHWTFLSVAWNLDD